VNYLRIAKGSLREVQSQLVLARRLRYLNDATLEEIDRDLIELSKMISGYIKYLDCEINN
jgi:four helix bundle protein